MHSFFLLLFLHFFTLEGFKTWFKPHSIRLTNFAVLDVPEISNGDEHDRNSKGILPHNDRWDFMYRATADYCQRHRNFPPERSTNSFEGHDDLNLGKWVNTQKRRYDDHEAYSSLSDDQLSKLMAIDEFREWAEDPLRDDDARWEVMYRATVDYCQHHKQLPPEYCKVSFEGHNDLNIYYWVGVQKDRYDGKYGLFPFSNNQLSKMMAIDEFRKWAEDPLRDADVRWEVMYRATFDCCQQHQQLPPRKYKTSYEGYDDLNLGGWVAVQKNRFDGKGAYSSLADEQLNKLMAIDEFRKWVDDPLRDEDDRWDFMYRATADYCQRHRNFPPERSTTSFEGHDDLKLGVWVVVQKNRFDGKGAYSSLTDEQLSKLMAIDEFRKWTVDPLRDDDVRWEVMYRATVDYCQQHQQLPPEHCIVSFEGHNDLKLGDWVSRQKLRYDGNEAYYSLSDDQLNKLMAIDEFQNWAEDPLRDDDVRWEVMYRATIVHCQHLRRLPTQDYIINFEGHHELKLGVWVDKQKQRYNGIEGTSPLTEDQRNKLMAIGQFREWVENPLRFPELRWEVNYDLVTQYCYNHHKLPQKAYKTIYEREEDGTIYMVKIGEWLKRRKDAYVGHPTSRVSEEQHDKLMQIPEFKSWALNQFGSTSYADFPHAHAKAKKSESKKKSIQSTLATKP